MRSFVGCVEVDEVAVLVGLVTLDEFLVFIELEELTVGVLQQGEFGGCVLELLVAEHAILDENLDVVPFLLKGLGVGLCNLLKAACHLLGDVR